MPSSQKQGFTSTPAHEIVCNTIYEDAFIRISTQDVVIKGYSLLGQDKVFAFADIQKVHVRTLNFWTGKHRIVGTGDFRTWLAADSGRAQRDVIFVVHPLRGWWKAGFSVEHAEQAVDALRKVRIQVQLPSHWSKPLRNG